MHFYQSAGKQNSLAVTKSTSKDKLWIAGQSLNGSCSQIFDDMQEFCLLLESKQNIIKCTCIFHYSLRVVCDLPTPRLGWLLYS